MTIDETAASAYESAPGYEGAITHARQAGDGGPIDQFVERIAERVGGKASVRAVFGDPIERDGLTIIPVAKVRWGFGGGSGTGPIAVGPGRPGTTFTEGADAAASRDQAAGSGTGAGGGVTADPIGWLEIGPDGATFQSISSPMPSPAFVLAAGAAAALLLGSVARLVRR